MRVAQAGNLGKNCRRRCRPRLDRMVDRFELELGRLEQALELSGPQLKKPPVIVIEGDQTGQPAQDLLGRADRPGRVMAARLGRIVGALEALHRLHDDEFVEPFLRQSQPAADKGAVLPAVDELEQALLVLQPVDDAAEPPQDERGQPGDRIEPPQQTHHDAGHFAHGDPCLLSSGGSIRHGRGV